MSKRYIPAAPFSVRDKNGIKHVFNPDRRGRDGTLGYTEAEIANLYKAHRKSFIIQNVEGDTVAEDVVERATAAPGEKRVTSSKAVNK